MAAVDPWLLVPGGLTFLIINQVGGFAGKVGKARGKYKVAPPKTEGPPEFNCVYRAHQNSLEFVPMVTSLIWLGSTFAHPALVALPGLAYVYFRGKYFDAYCEKPEKRTAPFYKTILAIKALAAVTVIGFLHTGAVGIAGFNGVEYVRGLIGM